jgi:hypothetical protein
MAREGEREREEEVKRDEMELYKTLAVAEMGEVILVARR